MKGTTAMKPALTKIAVSFALLMALTFVVRGTASAQSITTNHRAISITKIQAVHPQACGWTQLYSYSLTETGVGTSEIILWEYTCDGGLHCEAVDQSFHGYIANQGIYLELDTNNGNISTSKWPFGVGQALNTNTIGGATAASCYAYYFK
jgi:hypothetical protein